ncbi:MAG: hypothetical protein ACLPND_20495 [Candidatus Korobacteraceae bacterium]
MTRALTLVLFMLASLTMLAQTVTDIDTRAKPESGPVGYLLSSSARLSEDEAALSAEFVIADPGGLRAGRPFEYELMVTNRSKGPVLIPRALNWQDVEAGDGEPNSWAWVDLRVDIGDGLQGGLPHELKLYGSKDKTWSEAVLAPGETMHILGSGMLPTSMNINGKQVGKATLKGMFHLGTMRLYHTPTAQYPDAYRTESHWVFSAAANEGYAIDLEMVP